LHNLGFHDSKRQDATAYSWNYDQAQLWGLSYAATQYLKLLSNGSLPYNYQKPTRIARPVWP